MIKRPNIRLIQTLVSPLSTPFREHYVPLSHYHEDWDRREDKPDNIQRSLITLDFSNRCLDESLSCILIKEYYLCVCSMEVRARNIGAFLKSLGIVMGVVAVSFGVQFGLSHIMWDFSGLDVMWAGVVDTVHPPHLLISLVLTVAIAYYGGYVIHALAQSNQFRLKSGAGRNKMHDQLLVIISVVTFCHTIRVVLGVTKMVLTIRLLKLMKYCDGQTVAHHDRSCDDILELSTASMLYLGSMCCTFTEIFCVLLLVTMAKVKEYLLSVK